MVPISSFCKNIACLSQFSKYIQGEMKLIIVKVIVYLVFLNMIFPTLFMHQKHPQLSSILQLLGDIMMSTGVVNYLSVYVKLKLILQGRDGTGMSQTQASDVSLQWSVVVQGESTAEMRLLRKRFKLGPWHLAEEIICLITPWTNSTYWHEWEKTARVKDISFLNTHLEFQHLNFLLTVFFPQYFSLAFFHFLFQVTLELLEGTRVSGVIYKDT